MRLWHSRRCPLSTWMIFAVLDTVYLPKVACSEDTRDSTSAWLGRWFGVAHDKDEWNSSYNAETPIDIEFRLEDRQLVLIDRGRMSTKQAAVPVRMCGRRFFAQYERLFTNLADIEGVLSEDGASLDVTISRDGMTGLESHAARLQRDSVDAGRFHVPRVDAQGRRVTDNQYRVPIRMKDGLPVASASAEAIDPLPLANMTRRILIESGAIDSA